MASNKILVIDDTTVVRLKVRQMLPPGNFEVLEAKDGLEGLNFIRQEKLSLIMLDFLLPKMSGWEVFQQLQAQPELRKIPLVIMSGRKEEVTEKLTEPFEYFEFLNKPFDQKQLITAIKTAMAKAKKPRPETIPSAVAPKTKSTPVVATNTPNKTVVASAHQSGNSADINVLNEKITKMQAEIEGLKKQLAQVVTFIKQRVK
ncbi:response regulator [Chrysosporum bergii ANA360D]|uniref:Response regulator n=1 Tax=Chrysosporum bergii ANA360D TaxID=617107 RepID=A0AA43KCM4_9CYAN|nr:response regulator [Chrysosporum bergii]MDH6061048.1 response regulator [Chrysosporum bergii ANA360D]